MEIRRVHDTEDTQISALVAKSDDYLSSLYPPESNHAESFDSLISDRSAFFACYIEDQVVACGAVKVLEDDVSYGEIKRVFVDENQRGKNLATIMMTHLESWLRENGIRTARLEAGPKQPAALSLYRKLGYSERGPFGDYQPDPLSVFMEKAL